LSSIRLFGVAGSSRRVPGTLAVWPQNACILGVLMH
jgi:hypothetical protein